MTTVHKKPATVNIGAVNIGALTHAYRQIELEEAVTNSTF